MYSVAGLLYLFLLAETGKDGINCTWCLGNQAVNPMLDLLIAGLPRVASPVVDWEEVANCRELLGDCKQHCQLPKLLSALLNSLLCPYHFLLPSSLHPSDNRQKSSNRPHCMQRTVAQRASDVCDEWVAAPENGHEFFFTFFWCFLVIAIYFFIIWIQKKAERMISCWLMWSHCPC